jgi:hypothetical protein
VPLADLSAVADRLGMTVEELRAVAVEGAGPVAPGRFEMPSRRPVTRHPAGCRRTTDAALQLLAFGAVASDT